VTPYGVRAPWGRTGSGRWFDPLLGVVVLELGGTQVTERGVEPPRVKDVVDEAWEVGRDVLEGLVVHEVHGLDLESLHETLGLRIVVGVAASAHRTDQAVAGKRVAVDLGGVLRASDALMFIKRSGACLSLTVGRLPGEGVVDLSGHVAF
jgi:hypothetical protein